MLLSNTAQNELRKNTSETMKNITESFLISADSGVQLVSEKVGGMNTGMDAGKKIKTNRKTIILAVLTVLWMAVIFIFSAQPSEESAHLSGMLSTILHNISESLYGTNPPAFVNFLITNGEHFIRKIGHIAEYLLLGILVASLVKRLGVRRFILVSVLVCTLYAASDEFHQIFVPGRGPLVSDVLLDSCASFVGMLLKRRTRAAQSCVRMNKITS